jgi:hypothetical protein
MKHVPGHHGRGMEAIGPLVWPGQGYQELVATKSTMDPLHVKVMIFCRQGRERKLMSDRAIEIEAGLVHQTPAMEEALAKLARDNQA